MSDPPRVLVVHGFGSAGPGEVIRAARGVCLPVFVYDSTELATPTRHLLAQLDGAVDLATTSDVLDRLADLVPRGIVSFSEAQQRRTVGLAAQLGLDYHSHAVADLLADKFCQRQAVAAHGADDTRHALMESTTDVLSAAGMVGFPAVIKPTVGGASRNVHLVQDLAECQAVANRLLSSGLEQALVLEQYLAGLGSTDDGDYVSVETVTVAGGRSHLAVTGKFPLVPPFREGGMYAPADLAPDLREAVLDLTGAVLTALGVRHGMTHTEVKLTPAGPRLIEVNGRLGGHVADLARRAGGPCLVRAALRAALGIPPEQDSGWQCVAFQYFVMPPQGAVALHDVAGLAAARRVPGVTKVDVDARPRALPAWHTGSASRIGTVYGAVADHAQLRFVGRLLADTVRPHCLVEPAEQVGS